MIALYGYTKDFLRRRLASLVGTPPLLTLQYRPRKLRTMIVEAFLRHQLHPRCHQRAPVSGGSTPTVQRASDEAAKNQIPTTSNPISGRLDALLAPDFVSGFKSRTDNALPDISSETLDSKTSLELKKQLRSRCTCEVKAARFEGGIARTEELDSWLGGAEHHDGDHIGDTDASYAHGVGTSLSWCGYVFSWNDIVSHQSKVPNYRGNQ